MKRYLIIYSGIVQGVGFRYQIYMIANKYHLTGYVKNLSNGQVQVEVQGNNINQFLKESLEGTRFIEVDDYSIKEIPLIDNDSSFEIKYY